MDSHFLFSVLLEPKFGMKVVNLCRKQASQIHLLHLAEQNGCWEVSEARRLK